MQSEPVALALGDKCPNCQGELSAALVPTAEQRRRFEDREIREPLPEFSDTMTEQQRKEHGALYTCARCGYQTRFPLATDAGAGAPSTDGGNSSKGGRASA